MKTYQFEKLYDLLTVKEQRAFDFWIRGIVGNRQKTMILMYTNWKEGKNWEENIELLKLSTKNPKSRIDHLRGELQEKLEDYLSFLALKRDNLSQESLLLREVNDRGGENIFPLIAKKMQKKRNDRKVRDAFYHQAVYSQLTAQQSFLVKFPPRYRKKNELLTQRFYHWKTLFRYQALELGLNFLAQNRNKDMDCIPSVIEWINEENNFNDLPEPMKLMTDLYNIYLEKRWKRVTNQQDDDLFKRIKKFQFQFSPGTFGNLHILFFNYLILKTRHHLLVETHELMMEMYEWNASDHIWPISRKIYRTVNNIMAAIMLMGNKLPTFDKHLHKGRIIRFLENYRNLLPDNERKSAYKLNMANYYFAIGEYNEVLVQQYTEDHADPYYEVGYQATVIQARLELGELEMVPEAIHSLKQRIRKTKSFSEMEKKAYQNRLNLTLELTKIKSGKDAQKLLDKINQTQPLSGQVWLKIKANSLLE